MDNKYDVIKQIMYVFQLLSELCSIKNKSFSNNYN